MDGGLLSGGFTEGRAVLGSIVHRANGFVYRCRNDSDYSMLLMEGAVRELTGYPASDFTDGLQRSYAGLCHADDAQGMFAAVDNALARRENWAIDYRLLRPDGSALWVHEVGGGVFDAAGELTHLEGIVLDNEQRRREETSRNARNEDIAAHCRTLVSETKPILGTLRALRILAINARIEAARAGPAGAGFAVVAGEVGRIANETSEKAGKVADLTEALQKLLRQG